MTERKLVIINKSAGYLAKCVKDMEQMNAPKKTREKETPTKTRPYNLLAKSINVVMENDRSKRLINYKLRTNINDSPTKRLISMKSMNLKSSSTIRSREVKTSFTSSPQHKANNKTQ